MLSRNESKSESEKLPNAKTPVLLSSKKKNCAAFLLPLIGDVGVKCEGRTTSLKGVVSSMTLIRSLGTSGTEKACICWNRAIGFSWGETLWEFGALRSIPFVPGWAKQWLSKNVATSVKFPGPDIRDLYGSFPCHELSAIFATIRLNLTVIVSVRELPIRWISRITWSLSGSDCWAKFPKR